ncbi:SGNH/GDSL hydrolase family protein [Kineosporia sp. NBRC 101731]|uniref:SGNH/GDSL hydrolase family protein n=1 Tax=Kineosporia sp. NBRC 101731 TaxID=3032199 RepID=UPI0024A29D80|nr:SGNH/GDSL hydrolase family protein [Kineosporia sp. NBRC 101731]GLY32101.1 hypothetical protein Kisp02_54660 [Kineosporia sp. NBRC 101731]
MGLLDPPALSPTAAANQYPLSKLGVFVPVGWGQHWRTARAAGAAGTKLAKVAVYGDSIGHVFPSNLEDKTYPGRIQTALQAKYGDGGGGFFSAGYTQGQLSFSNAAWLADADKLATITGTWSAGPASGPGQRMIQSSADGSTWTKRVRGTTVGVWVAVVTSGAAGVFSATVDGGAAIPITSLAAYDGFNKVTLATGLTNTWHTIVVTKTGTTNAYLNGAWGENSTGVIVENYSAYGALSTNVGGGNFGNVNDLGRPVPLSGGKYNSSDLFIYAMCANDANGGATTPDAYVQNVETALRYVRISQPANNPSWNIDRNGKTDIILFQPFAGNFDSQLPRLAPQYTQRMFGLAHQYGAAIVTAAPLWQNSWSVAQAAGVWSTVLGSTPGGSGTDSVHISDIGAQAYADQLLQVIDS